MAQKFGDLRFVLSGGADTGGHWRIQDLREKEHYHARMRLDWETDTSISALDAGVAFSEGKLYTSLAPAWANNGLHGHIMLNHHRDYLKAHLSLNMINVDLDWDLPLYFGDVKLGEPPDVIEAFTRGAI